MKKISIVIFFTLIFLVSCNDDGPSYSPSGMDCPYCENGTGYIMNDFGSQIGTCEYCGGTGYLKYVSCHSCGGSGYVDCTVCHGSGNCYHCGGYGDIKTDCSVCDNDDESCYVCDGYGYTLKDCIWCYDGACSSCRGSGYTRLCSYCNGYGYWYVDKFGNMYW